MNECQCHMVFNNLQKHWNEDIKSSGNSSYHSLPLGWGCCPSLSPFSWADFDHRNYLTTLMYSPTTTPNRNKWGHCLPWKIRTSISQVKRKSPETRVGEVGNIIFIGYRTSLKKKNPTFKIDKWKGPLQESITSLRSIHILKEYSIKIHQSITCTDISS